MSSPVRCTLRPLLERARGRLVGTLTDADVQAGEARFDIAADGGRRVYAAGFVVTASTPTRVEAHVQHSDGSRSDPLDLKLEAGSTYAGVVELDAAPQPRERRPGASVVCYRRARRPRRLRHRVWLTARPPTSCGGDWAGSCPDR